MRTVCVIAATVTAVNAGWAAAAAVSAREEQAARKITYGYARCVVRHHHALAAKAILADEGNGTIMHDYAALIDSGCLALTAGGVKVTFGGDLYRYALADALVNLDFAAAGPTDLSDRPPLPHLFSPSNEEYETAVANARGKRAKAEVRSSLDQRRDIVWLSRYGECVVRADPADARLWLLTPPGIPAEAGRIDALKPAFSQCLTGTLTFNRTTMRGTVALNYYRLAMATPVPAAGKAN